MRVLSSTFVQSLHDYKDKNAAPPYGKREVSHDEAARNSKSFFSSIAKIETGEAAREALEKDA